MQFFLAKFAKYCQNYYFCIMSMDAVITPKMRKVAQLLIDRCVGMDYCMSVRSRNLVLEVPKTEIPEVINILKDTFEDVAPMKNAVPMLEVLHDFILVKPLISEAPLVTVDGIHRPSQEKYLVDILSDKDYEVLRKLNMNQLYQREHEVNRLNDSRLIRYAARKGKKEEVQGILDGLDNERIKTVHAIQDCLKAAPVHLAWLFGSYARMEERPDSDIDLLVDLDEDAHLGLLGFSSLMLQLQDATGRNIDLVAQDAVKPFARESIERDKVLIYERA